MTTALVRKSDIAYIRSLTKASYDGFTSALRKRENCAVSPTLTASVWVPAAIGAIVGILAARYGNRKQSGYKLAMVGVAGSALGFGAGVGYTTRGSTKAVFRSTMQKVNGVRDAHWLERNPINYA